jgi:predicted SprT family Zn-dependent metalloprotease
MRLEDAETLARSLMAEHKLRGWTFRFDNAKRRFGSCSFDTKTISVSRHLAVLNDEGAVRDTILHEIAHAMAGAGHGHDARWRILAHSIGATGTRCYDDDKIHTPPGRWIGTCAACGYQTQPRHRRREGSCGRCSSSFDLRFLLTWTTA